MINIDVQISASENGRRVPWDLQGDINGELSLKDMLAFIKKNLILISEEALAQEQAKGFDKNPIVLIDNKPGTNLQTVSPLGKIEYKSRVDLKQIAMDTYAAILDRSPVDTGQYKRLNIVIFNGAVIAQSLQELEAWFGGSPKIEDKDVLRFVNLAPYARKLERFGVTSGGQSGRVRPSRDKKKAQRGVLINAPNGTYYLAYRAIKRKYKDNSPVYFGMLPGDRMAGISSVSAVGRGGKTLRRTYAKTGRAYLYPSIKISVSSRGIL